MRVAVDLFTLLVVASVAVALAGLTWRVTGYDDGRSEVAIVTTAATTSVVDLAPILAFAPFGSSAVGPAAVSGTISSLGLSLRGIVLAVPRSASTALIAASDGVVNAYAVGQSVAGGAVIDAIAVDSVTLRTAAGVETLAFPAQAAAGVGAAAANSPGAAAVRALIPPSVLGVPPPAAPPPPPLAAAPIAPANPAAVLGGLGVSADGSAYRVTATPSPQLLAAGLRPGDVIERVNGIAPAELQSNPGALADAVASGRAQVEVLRDGQRLTLSAPLR